jgi:two-component system, LytTR family, response regulator
MPTTILIIEPDKKLLASIKKLLTNNDYHVVCASSPELGLKLLNKKEVDLILCDTELPNISGCDFLRKIAQNPAAESIPFIFLASSLGKSEIQLATCLGADGFVIKPISRQNLVYAIEKKIKKYRLTITKSLEKHLEPNHGNANQKMLSERVYILRMVNDQPTFIKISDLKCIVANGSYLTAHLLDGRTYKKRRSLSELEKKLPQGIFLRIHRSTIINIEHVERIEKWFNNTFRVYIKGMETPFEMSRRYTSMLRTRL